MSQKLTPELASKVKRADLKNIIDKVGAGKPLSGVERNLFDALCLTTEDIGRKRQLALLGKWSNGKRLNATELAEISDLLPEGSIQEDEPEVEIKLGRNGYFHSYSYYVPLYGSAERTVKRWVSIGRKAGDPCPLDEPEKLRVWWARRMQKQCPDEILAAAISDVKSGVCDPEPDEEVGDDPEKEVELKPRELLPVGDDEVGLEATLARLRNAEVQANRMMIEAMRAGDEGKASLAQKMWTGLTTQVRQVEKDARLEAVEMGALIPKLYAEQKLIELHSGIEKGMRGMYRRMCEVMRIPIDPATEGAWNGECDKLFIQFQESLLE